MIPVVEGHPALLCGHNSAAMALDELNGAGRYDLWPTFVDSSESYRALVLEHDDYGIFAGCANLTFPAENRVIEITAEDRIVDIQGRCAA
jgi:hypothetical protein